MAKKPQGNAKAQEIKKQGPERKKRNAMQRISLPKRYKILCAGSSEFAKAMLRAWRESRKKVSAKAV